MRILKKAKRLVEAVGLDVKRNDPQRNVLLRRRLLIKSYNINLVLDVGANVGHYAIELREMGYRGRIVSFEPMTSAYAKLSANRSNDSLWKTVQVALGDQDGQLPLHIAGNSESSSFLEMLPSHLHAAPESEYLATETVQVKRLDSIYFEFAKPGDEVFLKIDAQGYEKQILEGAFHALTRINTIQLEMSLVPLYKGECLLPEMVTMMYRLGFVLVSLEPSYTDVHTGQLFQTDGIFHRYVKPDWEGEQ